VHPLTRVWIARGWREHEAIAPPRAAGAPVRGREGAAGGRERRP
jgi:hypothetical protein